MRSSTGAARTIAAARVELANANTTTTTASRGPGNLLNPTDPGPLAAISAGRRCSDRNSGRREARSARSEQRLVPIDRINWRRMRGFRLSWAGVTGSLVD